MQSSSFLRCVSAVVLAFGASTSVYAQASSKPPAQTEPLAPLGGPRVASPVARHSLITRDFNGSIERLEIPPEEAAIKLLTLGEAEKTATQAVLSERAAALDKAVRDNYPLVLKLQGFREASRADRLAMLKEWNAALESLRARGKLVDELAAGLTPENAAKLRELSKEYWDAIIEEDVKTDSAQAGMDRANRDSKGDFKPRGGSKGQAVAREYLLGLGHEIRRSFDRQIASGQAQLESVLAKVEATDEQAAKIKQISLDYLQQSLGKPAPDLRINAFRKVMDVLTPAQRRVVVAEYFGKDGDKPKAHIATPAHSSK